MNSKSCEFGCGRPARFLLKMGKSCCERFCQSCPAVRRKNSESKVGKCPKWKKGHPRGFAGKKSWNSGVSYESVIGKQAARRMKNRIGRALAGRTLSQEQKMVLSEVAKRKGTGGYRMGGGRGKHGWYRGIWCDSSWELAWVMYNLDHGVDFERNRDWFEYVWDGVKHRYLPDFKLPDGRYVEIKAWLDDQGRAKLNACPGVVMLMKAEMEPFLRYAIKKYGKRFVRMYEKRER